MKKSQTVCDTDSCMLCRLCLKEWIPAVGANRQNFTYKKGQTLFAEGDVVTGIYFIYEGIVKVHKRWGPGKELILRFAKKGDIVGHRGFGSEQYYPVTATALEPVTVCFISLDFFRASLKVNYGFIYELMMFFVSELQQSEKNMRNLAHMNVKGRVAQALLHIKEQFGINQNGSLLLSLSRQDLASYAGTTYETVFRILHEFSELGFIDVSGKEITVIREDRLTGLTVIENG